MIAPNASLNSATSVRSLVVLPTSPANVVSGQVTTVADGVYVDPASKQVEADYVLDPRDTNQRIPAAPPGFAAVAANRSWRVAARC